MENSAFMNDVPLRAKIVRRLRWIFHNPKKECYSENGEDIILQTYFSYRKRKKGFYIDIGAYRPIDLSNTYLFYRQGWKGINIEANPGLAKEFKKVRKRDINLSMAVSSKSRILEYYTFKNCPGFNTFCKTRTREIERKTGMRPVKLNLKTLPLGEILKKYLPPNQDIAFMSVDVEGFESEVLKSNDWHRYRPEMLIVEMLDESIETILSGDLYKFIVNQGYVFYAWPKPSLIFSRKK